MTQDATTPTGGSEVDRLRDELADTRHRLLTVQDHVIGLEAENGRLHRDLVRVTTELRQLRKRVKHLAGQRDDLRSRLQDTRTRLERNRSRVGELEAAGRGVRPSIARRAARKVRSALR